MLPLAVVLAVFLLSAREAPARSTRRVRPMREVLREADLWWFSLFYSVTFGGYARRPAALSAPAGRWQRLRRRLSWRSGVTADA
jgi:NNP family nitrate/nitrite transporter-like MFS transporter